MQTRISATITPDLKDFLLQMASEWKSSQSDILEKALRLLQRKIVQEKMKAGYRADNEEALEFAHQAEKITTFYDEM